MDLIAHIVKDQCRELVRKQNITFLKQSFTINFPMDESAFNENFIAVDILKYLEFFVL